MTKNITISVSDDLGAKVEKWRDAMNTSKVCEKALETEIARLEEFPKFGKELEETLQRLRREKEESYRLGLEAGVEYIKNEVSLAELRRLRYRAFSELEELPSRCRDRFKQLIAGYVGDEGCVHGEFRDLPLNKEEYVRGCRDGIESLSALVEDNI